MAKRIFDFDHLTPAERADLAMQLWDSLPEDSSEPPLTDSQRAELSERLRAHRRSPTAGSPWAEVRERIRRRYSDTP
ncbi:MAG: addiction module protein [Longimicrobiales bacterium]